MSQNLSSAAVVIKLRHIFVLTGDNRYYTLNNGSSSTFEPEDVDSDDELSDSEVHYVRPGRKNSQNSVCLFCCFTSQVNSYGHVGMVSSPNDTFSG